jgi:hypothetical protein
LDIDVSLYKGNTPVSIRDAKTLVVKIENDNSNFFNTTKSRTANDLILSFKNSKSEFYNEQKAVYIKNGATQSKAKAAVDKTWTKLLGSVKKEVGLIGNASISVNRELVNLKGYLRNEGSKKFLSSQGTQSYGDLLDLKTIFDNRYQESTKKLDKMVTFYVLDNAFIENVRQLSPDRNAGIASDDSVAGRVVGSPIFNPYIGEIAGDVTNWDLYNTNSFTALGGDAQFVAVGKGLIEFRQKSLDFDPSAAVAAGSALTKAGLKLSAAFATGRFEQQSTDGQNLMPSFNKAKMKQLKGLLERRLFARRQLLNTLAKIHEEDMPSADSSKIEKADSAKKIEKNVRAAVAWFEAQLLIPLEE